MDSRQFVYNIFQNFSELAWELDRKAVHHHKIQRTPIKLNIFAGNPSSDKNEMIGYIVLDLRGASSSNHTSQAKWMPLLSSKYSKFKPELSVELNLEEEQSDGANNVLQENNSGKLPVETKEENGKPFLQIGKGGSMYIFSLSLYLASVWSISFLPIDLSMMDSTGFISYEATMSSMSRFLS